jgi:hypothetical protein
LGKVKKWIYFSVFILKLLKKVSTFVVLFYYIGKQRKINMVFQTSNWHLINFETMWRFNYVYKLYNNEKKPFLNFQMYLFNHSVIILVNVLNGQLQLKSDHTKIIFMIVLLTQLFCSLFLWNSHIFFRRKIVSVIFKSRFFRLPTPPPPLQTDK